MPRERHAPGNSGAFPVENPQPPPYHTINPITSRLAEAQLMDVTLLPSCVSLPDQPPVHVQHLSAYLVNESVAVDAGSLGLWGTPADQHRIRYVFLTHAHVDHIATLPLFVENAFRAGTPCVTIFGSDDVLATLRRHIFNDMAWPDLERISADYPDTPLIHFETLEPGRPVEVDGLRITPVPVDHTIPALGLIVEEPGASVVFSADTGPTQALWTAAASAPNLRAVFLEASFPDELAWLADRAKHLTPSLFASEIAKLRALRPDCDAVRFLAIHLKPKYRDRVSEQLLALGIPNIEICEPGRLYRFARDVSAEGKMGNR